jgi:hypothetical protein
MGYTTKISDYELERGNPPQKADDFKDDDETTVTKSKVVEPKDKKPPVSTTAVTKDAEDK